MSDESEDSGERPRRRRRKNKPEKSKTIYFVIAGGVGLTLTLGAVILVIVLIALRSGKDKLVPTTEYEGYDSPEDVFHIDFPKGWQVQGGGGRKNYYWASAERGSASIKISESLVGSLVGDIAGAATPDPNVSDELLPVSKVHELKKLQMPDEFDKYQEQPAVTVKTKYGKVRRSEFTATKGLGSKIRGYRATGLGVLTQLTIVCYCSTGDWDIAEPAFARSIESLSPGLGGR
jgi:hypothetical protein